MCLGRWNVVWCNSVLSICSWCNSDMEPVNDFYLEEAAVESKLSAYSCMKENKSKKKSGGFQSMGLSFNVLKGILRKGYKVPTPIQRKTIPVILEGQDVVAMARTGSGKTAAFLVPLFEKLKCHSAKTGARALIFSPTRELAIQTMKFTKEIGKFVDLKAVLVLGGEKMEEQFAAIHENPDIIIATPGRFLHLVIEMDLKLSSIEYIVFDEADRLFEMGFQDQLQEVLRRLPENHQTLLFSATLPCILVDFVRAGLSDPVLIRLDVDHKLSENLKTCYLCCRSSDKPAILVHLLKTVVNLAQQLTVVFLSTRHHVEYTKELLEKANIPCSYIYSSLDQAARKINVAKFKAKKASVLLVTDIAARGIDIPLLDNVINYNFPSKPKLFVHRVGRVARAGRSGIAYSLVAPDEMPFLLDLHLFMGKPLKFPESGEKDEDGVCGFVPQSIIDEEADMLRVFHETSNDLQSMATVCSKAYMQYVKSRPSPSSESVKRVKELSGLSNRIHPMFNSNFEESIRRKMLSDMKNYRANSTIFEIGATAKNQASKIMRMKRIRHSVVDRLRHQKGNHSTHLSQNVTEEEFKVASEQQMSAADDSDIMSTFTVIMGRKNESKNKDVGKPNKFKDTEYYIPYHSKEYYSEKGLGLRGSFEEQASSAVLDLTGDDTETAIKMKSAWHWDRKRKRFVKDDGSEHQKKMKTESGVWIPKSYKTDIYKKWKDRNKVSFEEQNSDTDESGNEFGKKRKGMKEKSKAIQNKNKKKFKGLPRREIKTKEEILKQRKVQSRKQFHQKRRQNERGSKRRVKRNPKDMEPVKRRR